jgi:hypothetical protein
MVYDCHAARKAASFLRNLIKAVPYAILTDDGIQFTNRPGDLYASMVLSTWPWKAMCLTTRPPPRTGMAVSGTAICYVSYSRRRYVVALSRRRSLSLRDDLPINPHEFSAPADNLLEKASKPAGWVRPSTRS